MKSFRRLASQSALPALLFAALALAGCPPQQPAPETEPLDPMVEGIDPAAPVEPGVEPEMEHQVTVTLADGEIQMPTTLSAGPTTFNIRNDGTTEHSLEAHGNGMHHQADRTLQPGEQTTLTVDLTPGSLRFYCPVGDHADQGMELEVEVVDDQALPAY